MKSKCTDCGIYEAVSGDELCEECRESANEPTPNPLIQAIEIVIAELEHEKSLYRPSDFEEEKDDGVILAYSHAIRRLKEVLKTDVPTSNRQTSPGGTHDSTKQVQE